MSAPPRPIPPRRRPRDGGDDHNQNAQQGASGPRVRRGMLHIPAEVARRLRAGHPWVFRDTLGTRPLRDAPGELVELVDPDGGFIGRGYYDPEGPIAVRLLSRDPDERLDATAFLHRITAARRLRDAMLPDPQSPAAVTAYRAFHGEGDFLPGLTVDRYADHLVVHLFTAALEPHLPAIYDGLEAVWQPRAIYAQKRYRPLGTPGEGAREPAELARGAVAPVDLEVREGPLRFLIDVTAPLGTGLFPDLRLGRQRVGTLAPGRRVLNLFSYTGALSLYAAVGGAKEVVSVDLAARAHARARRNLSQSGLPETGHEFIAADGLTVMAKMAERRRSFDMIIVDPPAFSQSRGQTFSVQKDYRDLVSAALLLCAPGAILCCSSNSARFSLDEFETAIGEGAGRAGRHVRIIEQIGLPVDFPIPAGFPEGHYLKFLVCAVV